MTLNEMLIRRAIEASPMGRAVSGTQMPHFPSVPAPSLQGLALRVAREAGEARDARLFNERLQALRRQRAVRRQREGNEPIALGDEVTSDVLGYSRGQLVPKTLRRRLTVVVGNPDYLSLPGFTEGLQTHRVSSSVQLSAVLPADFPVASFRGRPAIFAVVIREATQLTLPPLEDGALMQATFGKTFEQLNADIKEQVRADEAKRLHLQGVNEVLRRLAQPALAQVSDALVEDCLSREWLDGEGKALLELNICPDDREQAFKALLRDPAIREYMRSELAVSSTLLAIMKQERLELTAPRARELAQALLGGDVDLRTVPVELADIARLSYLNAVEHVVSRSQIEVVL